ncbi:MAG: hypothetical protein GX558_08620 [Clostridiales bacterium]|nr:hypothetical protein [Clostridiales bacterium]
MNLIWLLIAHLLGGWWADRPDARRRRSRSARGIAPRSAGRHADRKAAGRAAIGAVRYAALVGAFAMVWQPRPAEALAISALALAARALAEGLRRYARRPLMGYAAGEAIFLFAIWLCARLLPQASAMLWPALSYLGVTPALRGMYAALAYLAVTAPAAELVRRVLAEFEGGAPAQPPVNAGAVIGILERLVVLTLALIGQYGVIGFVLTAKSVARFKEFEDRDFAERYIIGTLTSVGVAIALAAIAALLPA